MDQKIVLITGANRGIGYATAEALGKLGMKILLGIRDDISGKETEKKLIAQGFDARYIFLDVTQEKNIKDTIALIIRDYGRLDVLINNAGILIDDNMPSLEISLDIIQKTIATNVYGPLLLCQAVIPIMKRNRYGRIVNISSEMGSITNMTVGGNLGYRISKAALNVLTRVFSDEAHDSRILINSMCPGWVQTSMGGADAPKTVEEGADTVVFLATLPENGPRNKFFQDRQEIAW